MSTSKYVVMFSRNDEEYQEPMMLFLSATEAASYLQQNRYAKAETLLTSVSNKIRGAANGEKVKNHIGSYKNSNRVTAFGFRWAFLDDLPSETQQRAIKLAPDLVKKEVKPKENKKYLSANEITTIIKYLKADWGRNEIAYKVGCNSDTVYRINVGRYKGKAQVEGYKPDTVIQDNSTPERKAIIKSREASAVIAKATVIDENKKGESYFVFRSSADLVLTGKVNNSFMGNINNAMKGRKNGATGHAYCGIEWYSLKDIVTEQSGAPKDLLNLLLAKKLDLLVMRSNYKNHFSENAVMKTSVGDIAIYDIKDALEIDGEHLSLLIDYYKDDIVSRGRIKSQKCPYGK